MHSGGSKFKSDTPLVSDSDLDAYRVVYLYKDPVEAMVSRFGHGHCTHIQGDCGPSDAQVRAFISLGALRLDTPLIIHTTFLSPSLLEVPKVR